MRIAKLNATVRLLPTLFGLLSACGQGTESAADSGSTSGSTTGPEPAGAAATMQSQRATQAEAGRSGASGTGKSMAATAGSGSVPRTDAGSGGISGVAGVAAVGGGGTSASAGGSGPSAAGVGGVVAAAGASGAAMATEMCVKGQVKASEVAFIGTSVIAAGKIAQDTSDFARMAGVIGANESYRSKAVVGAQIIPDSTSPIEGIPSQFMSAVKEGPVKVVLMEGGINDLLWGGRCKDGDDDAPCMELVATVQTLFMTMQKSGVQDVVYFFYPDPGAFMGQDVKAATDTLRPKMQKVCEEATEVRCVFADPRPAWEGHYDMFTSDGIHPTDAGSAATAKVVWDAMVANCVAQ